MKQSGKFYTVDINRIRNIYWTTLGYHERAFGTLQAQVEFSLYCPQVFEVSTEISFEDMVAEFDEFWDSEVPRFGEKVCNCFVHRTLYFN